MLSVANESLKDDSNENSSIFAQNIGSNEILVDTTSPCS